jgi:REP element-mobilizing transposase RayT
MNYPFFYTATILEWKHLLKLDKYKQIIIDSLAFLCNQNKVKVYGFVIMPNHIHLIWQINSKYSLDKIQQSFMKYTAQQIKADLTINHPLVLEKFKVSAKDRKYQIWERNPLSIQLFSKEVLIQKLNYIHNNPYHEKWNIIHQNGNYHYSSELFYNNLPHNFHFLTHYNELF